MNRNYSGKEKGLVVDYIGIKNQMNQALAMYSKTDEGSIEDVEQSVVVVRDHLDLVKRMKAAYDICSGSDVFAQAEVFDQAEHYKKGQG